MKDLTASLGLDQVEADPNAVPDGRYDGVITRDEYAFSKAKNNVGHAINYQVTEGPHKGAQHSEWFTIGTDPLDADGNPTDNMAEMESCTVTMGDDPKKWYKKRLQDLGWTPEQISEGVVGKSVGIKVTYGVKYNNGYRNVNFAERAASEGGPYVAPKGNVSSGNATTQATTPQAPVTPEGLGNLL